MALIIKTVGATGRDYTTVAAAVASIPADVVASGNSYVIELEKAIYGAIAITNFNCSATNNITLRPIAGHGYRDSLNFAESPLRYDSTRGASIESGADWVKAIGLGNTSYVVLDGLQISTTGAENPGIAAPDNATETTVRNCLIRTSGAFSTPIKTNRSLRAINNVILQLQGDQPGIRCQLSSTFISNTIFAVNGSTNTAIDCAAYGQATRFQNNALFGFANAIAGAELSPPADGRNATNLSSMAYAAEGSLLNLVAADQFMDVTPASLDLRLKPTSAMRNVGAPTTESTTSLNNANRSTDAGYDIGAWEVAATAEAPTVSAPTISAEPAVGVAVGYTSGTVNGVPAPTVTQQWTLDGVDIPNATDTTYVPVVGDTNKALRVRQIVTNSQGTANATSAPRTVMGVDETAPSFVSASMNTAGTEITLTFNEAIPSVNLSPSAFTGLNRSIGSFVFSGNDVKLVGLTPAIAFGDVVAFSYAKPSSDFLVDAAGNAISSFSTGTIPNVVPNRPTLPGYTVKVFGDSGNVDFTTDAQVEAYVKSTDYVALGSKVMIYLAKNLDLRNRNLTPSSLNDDYYPTLRPLPGQSFDDLEPNTAPGAIGTLGVEVLMDNTGIGNGVRIENLRVRASGNTDVVKFAFNGLQHGTTRSEGGFYSCRVIQTGPGRIFEGEYGFFPTYLKDCLVVVDANNTQPIIHSKGRFSTARNTFVRLNGAVGYTAIACDYGSRGDHDNIFKGCGGAPITVLDQGSDAENNYTDTPVTGYSGTKMVYVSGAFFESASNYRPAAGSVLIGAGAQLSVSTLDNNGNNRGPDPDVGAFQRTAAPPLARGHVTLQYPVDGQSLKIDMAIFGNPDSGTLSLMPATPPNGAQSVGPVPIVFNVDKSAATVEVDNIESGDYIVSVLLQNAGGIASVTGTSPISVMGMGNMVYDTGLSGTGASEPEPSEPPVIAISTAASAIMTGKTASLSGTVSPAATAQVLLYLDSQTGGGTVAITGTASITDGVWVKSFTTPKGLWKIRAVATANGQTASASTANIRVLSLTGTFNLPA